MTCCGDCGAQCQLSSNESTVPPSSHWTTTANTMGIPANTGEVSLLFFCCMSTSLLWWSSSQSCPIGLWSKTGMMPQTCLLNINVAGLSKPWPNGIVCICSRAIFMSLPELEHFLNVHFINLIQASTCPLLWWWYANDTTCSTLIVLQNCWNLSDTKLVPASDIIFWGIPYSVNMSWWQEICCCNLQYTNSFYYWNGIHLLWLLPMAQVVCHDEWSFPLAVSAEIQDM